MNTLTLRTLQPNELGFAASLTEAEGWGSETLAEFEGFYAYAPGGCLVAELDGIRVGMAVATPYGEAGFTGEIIVLPAARGQGVGAALVEAGIDFLHRSGAASLYLDGVVKAVSLYERHGYRKVCRSLRFFQPAGDFPGQAHPLARPMQPADLGAVCALDRQQFGADRSFFIRRRLERSPELAWVLAERPGGDISGYIVGRRGQGLVTAGPWVVDPMVDCPEALLLSLAAQVQGEALGLGVLESNARSVALMRSLSFQERPDPPWRMVNGPWPGLGAAPGCLAVGSAAKG